MRGVLRHIGNYESRSKLYRTRMFNWLTNQEFKQTAFTASVFAIKHNAISLPYHKRNRLTYRYIVIADCNIRKRSKCISVIFQGCKFQVFGSFDIFQKSRFLLDCLLLSCFDYLWTLHHFCRFMTDISFVSRTDFRCFYTVWPYRRTFCRLL